MVPPLQTSFLYLLTTWQLYNLETRPFLHQETNKSYLLETRPLLRPDTRPLLRPKTRPLLRLKTRPLLRPETKTLLHLDSWQFHLVKAKVRKSPPRERRSSVGLACSLFLGKVGLRGLSKNENWNFLAPAQIIWMQLILMSYLAPFRSNMQKKTWPSELQTARWTTGSDQL